MEQNMFLLIGEQMTRSVKWRYEDIIMKRASAVARRFTFRIGTPRYLSAVARRSVGRSDALRFELGLRVTSRSSEVVD